LTKIKGIELFNDFLADVKAKPNNHNRLVKLAVKRHRQDLKKSKAKKAKYYFDEKAVAKAIQFIKLLKHTKGEFANKSFDLQPFQAFIVGSLFGWKKKSNGKRRFTKAYIEVARKNGKTELAAAIGAYMLIADKEHGSEVYSAATKKDQSKICFRAATSMLKKLKSDSPMIDQLVDCGAASISVTSTESFFKPLAADDKTEDGTNPHCGIIDEYHAHPTDGMVKVLETGMGARLQPLLLIITTAGFNTYSPCFTFRKVCVNYLEGTLKNESTFCIIFTLDEGDEWHDPDVWIKSNPNLGNAPYLSYMENQCNNALTEGATAEVEFKTKNLNMWTNTAATWISAQDLVKCRSELEEIPAGAHVLGGLDLSSTRDITAFSLYAPEFNLFANYFFVPEDKVKDRRNYDGVNYGDFQKEGHLIVTEGNVIDYGYLKKFIIEIASKYILQCVAYDRFNSSQLVVELANEGLKFIGFAQGFSSMSAPTKEIEKRIHGQDITYVFSSVIEWMFSNVAIKKSPEGHIKVDKHKSKNKIDGIVAMIMAYALSMSDEFMASVYETRGMIVLSADKKDDN